MFFTPSNDQVDDHYDQRNGHDYKNGHTEEEAYEDEEGGELEVATLISGPLPKRDIFNSYNDEEEGELEVATLISGPLPRRDIFNSYNYDAKNTDSEPDYENDDVEKLNSEISSLAATVESQLKQLLSADSPVNTDASTLSSDELDSSDANTLITSDIDTDFVTDYGELPSCRSTSSVNSLLSRCTSRFHHSSLSRPESTQQDSDTDCKQQLAATIKELANFGEPKGKTFNKLFNVHSQ